jgi:hypothetical protein
VNPWPPLGVVKFQTRSLCIHADSSLHVGKRKSLGSLERDTSHRPRITKQETRFPNSQNRCWSAELQSLTTYYPLLRLAYEPPLIDPIGGLSLEVLLILPSFIVFTVGSARLTLWSMAKQPHHYAVAYPYLWDAIPWMVLGFPVLLAAWRSSRMSNEPRDGSGVQR